MIALTSVLALGLVVLTAACFGEQAVSIPEGPEGGRCAPARFSPTYFPWRGFKQGPGLVTSEGSDSIVQWFPPTKSPAETYLTLTSHFEPPADLGEFPKVPVHGRDGRLVWIGDPGVGELALYWSEGDEACDHYSLHLLDRSFSEREAEDELARVARSLK